MRSALDAEVDGEAYPRISEPVCSRSNHAREDAQGEQTLSTVRLERIVAGGRTGAGCTARGRDLDGPKAED